MDLIDDIQFGTNHPLTKEALELKASKTAVQYLINRRKDEIKYRLTTFGRYDQSSKSEPAGKIEITAGSQGKNAIGGDFL